MSLGNYIRLNRKLAGLTQKELAEFAELGGSQFISNIERGVSPIPKEKIRAVARELGVKPEFLVEEMVKEYEIKCRKVAKICD